MQGKLIGAVFLAMVTVNLYAQDQTNQPNPNTGQNTTQQPPSAADPATPAPVTPPPASEVPAPQQQAPAVQTINCEYNIPPETKTIDDALILEWAKQAANQSFDLDHTNLDQQIAALEACYTEQGWKGFRDALEKSGNLDAIKKQSLLVNSQLSGPAVIIPLKANQWKVTLPLQVIYKNDKETLTQSLTVTLSIARKPNGNPGIMQLIAVPKQKDSEEQKPIENNQPSEINKTTNP